ncbi:MAG: hypothetical protein RJB34_622 [Pseudomonadota bacterium]|jgi:uncharacterized protein (TIGR00255 family)
MAVYSMTGYATAAPTTHLGVEIRSVNSRFLDLTFKLPDELRGSEPALRERTTARLKRGKVEMRVWIEGRSETEPQAPSATTLQKLLNVQNGVQAWLPQAAALSVAEVLQLTRRQSMAVVDAHDELLALADQALDALMKAREREGQRLAAMLLDHSRQLRELARQAQPLIPKLVAQQRQRFLDRWNEAMGNVGSVGSEAAQDRALNEATAFAIRIDVAEEITRLDAHLGEIDRLLGRGGDMGKRLDFLIQELHREANTLGSKSSSLDLTRISVDMKVLIEQMREQVQNIE